MTLILGLSAFYHDSAAALLRDGAIVAAAQEERFSRRKHDEGFPSGAVEYCLRTAGCRAADLDYVGFYDKPLAKFDRLMRTYLAFAPRGYQSLRRSAPAVAAAPSCRIPRALDRGLGGAYAGSYVFTDHHESHAASAFFPSPFDEAAILTLDGVGEWSTASFGRRARQPHRVDARDALPAFAGTALLGVHLLHGLQGQQRRVQGDGPGPLRRATVTWTSSCEHLIDLKDDGSFRMDMRYFNYCQGLTMTSAGSTRLFGGPPREPEAPAHAAGNGPRGLVQAVTEEIMLRAGRHVHRNRHEEPVPGRAAWPSNCVGNGRILREGPFENVWMQPASGDAGGALGVALFIWHQLLDQPRAARPSDSQGGSLLGPEYSDAEIQAFLDGIGVPYEHVRTSRVSARRSPAASRAAR